MILVVMVDYQSEFGKLFCLNSPPNPFAADPALARDTYI